MFRSWLVMMAAIAAGPVLAKNMELEQIVSTYEANQARFHAQYRGKKLTGTATVISIKTDPLGAASTFYVFA